MSIIDKIKAGRALVMELPVYRGPEAVLEASEADVDGFLIPDVPTGRIGPDGLSIPYILPKVRSDRFILAQATGRRDISSNLSRIKGGITIGIRSFYLVYGDVKKGCGVPATELIAKVKGSFPEAYVGAALSPGRRNEAGLLTKKIRSGADFFITQICFDIGPLLSLVQKVKLDRPLLLALAVNASPGNLKRMKGLGINIPERVEKRILYSDRPRDESTELARSLYEEFSSKYEGPLSAYLVPFGELEGLDEVIGRFKYP